MTNIKVFCGTTTQTQRHPGDNDNLPFLRTADLKNKGSLMNIKFRKVFPTLRITNELADWLSQSLI